MVRIRVKMGTCRILCYRLMPIYDAASSVITSVVFLVTCEVLVIQRSSLNSHLQISAAGSLDDKRVVGNVCRDFFLRRAARQRSDVSVVYSECFITPVFA